MSEPIFAISFLPTRYMVNAISWSCSSSKSSTEKSPHSLSRSRSRSVFCLWSSSSFCWSNNHNTRAWVSEKSWTSTVVGSWTRLFFLVFLGWAFCSSWSFANACSMTVLVFSNSSKDSFFTSTSSIWTIPAFRKAFNAIRFSYARTMRETFFIGTIMPLPPRTLSPRVFSWLSCLVQQLRSAGHPSRFRSS